MATRRPTDVYLEVGSKRTFACAVAWPGWIRSGKGEEEALEALAESEARYAAVAKDGGLPFSPGALTVVERVSGNATTDFGAPGVVPECDKGPLAKGEAARLMALLGAAWRALDDVAKASPASLRKGPKGGGRDRDEVVLHVVSAESSYARKIGVRISAPDPKDAKAVAVVRHAILGAIESTDEIPSGPRGGQVWPRRYAARRIAWHVLDHAWEIEDRSGPK